MRAPPSRRERPPPAPALASSGARAVVAALLCGGLTLGLLARCAPAGAQARDPLLIWRTLETPHFRVHYHLPLGLLARRTAAVAERAHGSLATVLGFEPSERVEVVLTDESDAANGSATALPFDTIRLYAEAPDDLSPLGDYDDWMTLLVTHEHTHILHLDQATGLPALINAILGKVYMPNHVSPRWLLEGIAVWQESALTAGGRLRSTQWDMYLRMDALEDRFWTLDQVTTDADRWPHGNAAYLYGSYFVQFVADRYGREAVASMIRDYAGSVLPYGLNRVAERATSDRVEGDAEGRSFEALWREFLDTRRASDRALLARIEGEGRVEGRRLTTHGEIARAPRFLRDGSLLYMRADARSRARIVVVDREGNVERELARVNGGGEAAVAPDGRSVVFSRVDAYRDAYFYSDLFERDLVTDEERRLTEGLRAREPDVSRDGRMLTFTTSRAGTSHLHVAQRHDVRGTMRELSVGPRFSQVYTPRFSPDGRTIACSRWLPGGYRDVVLVDVRTGAIEELTHDRALDTGPVWSHDGRTLYFSSDRTGIANLYAYRLATGALEQITNVIGGAYQPAISDDGTRLVYVGYTSWGFDLFELDLRSTTPRPAPPYHDTRPPPSDTSALFHAESSDYDPLPTLYPRSYIVDLGQDSWGPQLGLSIAGEDVLSFHRWSARLGVGLARGSWQLDAGYAYNRSQLGVSINVYRNESLAGGLEVAGEERSWAQEAVGSGASVSYTFPRSFRSDTIGLSYGAAYTRPVAPFAQPNELDPNTPPPRLPEHGFFSTLRFGWSYSDIERYTYDISASNGRAVSLSGSISDPLIGSDYRVMTLQWSVQQYVPLWEQHVLALRYAGGVSGGDLERRGIFAVGGFPAVSPLDSLLAPVVLGGAALRGYAANARIGTQYHLAQIEYRFPIVRFNQGYATLPVFLNRMYALVFFDYGDAFSRPFDLGTFRAGLGGEFLLDLTLFYILGFTLRVGYARGLSEGGIDQVYGNLGVPF
ncbi:MAG: hypothetical protein OHK0013_29570 [Sandaracinaceae bacterium]